MNIAEAFIAEHDLGKHLIKGPLYSLTLTPRFPASRHVVFLLMTKDQTDPVMVGKVPRLPKLSDSLEREVQNLREIQARRPGGYDSIPRVLAFESYRGYPILIETALVGPLLSPDIVRRNPERHTSAVIDWLIDLHQVSTSTANWFEQIAEKPLRYLEQHLTAEEAPALTQLRQILQPLQNAALPLVLEHGDLSHPNLILMKSGGIGVVDWELSEVRGMAGFDMFFFLSYVAFSLSNANDTGDYLTPFRETFFQPDTWAATHIRRYQERLQIPMGLMQPLFALCWTRYLGNLLMRLRVDDDAPVAANTLAQLRENRYYALWRYTVEHIEAFTVQNNAS
jgi:aminoglycoside phosphotransferase